MVVNSITIPVSIVIEAPDSGEVSMAEWCGNKVLQFVSNNLGKETEVLAGCGTLELSPPLTAYGNVTCDEGFGLANHLCCKFFSLSWLSLLTFEGPTR